MLLNPDQIARRIQYAWLPLVVGLGCLSLIFLLHHVFVGLFLGYTLCSYALYAGVLRKWETEPGVWILAALLLVTLTPIWLWLEWRHWSFVLSHFLARNPPALPLGEQLRTIEATLAFFVAFGIFRFVLSIAILNRRLSRAMAIKGERAVALGNAWCPSAKVTTHAEHPIPVEMDFFVAPPAEIGEVISAYSTLTRGNEPVAPTARMIIGILVASVLALGAILVIRQFKLGDEMFAYAEGAVVGLVGLSVVYVLTRFKHTCSYVGQHGLARYTLRGSRDGVYKVEEFDFGNATDLFSSQTSYDFDGRYVGTDYFYRWTNASGKQVFNLEGKYKSQPGTPEAGDPFYFASKGEIAWKQYLLVALQAELER